MLRPSQFRRKTIVYRGEISDLVISSCLTWMVSMKLFVWLAGSGLSLSPLHFRDKQHTRSFQTVAKHHTVACVETEGWVSPQAAPSLCSSAFWDSQAPRALAPQANKITCSTETGPGQETKRCRELVREGYYWGKAIQVTSLLECPTRRCIVNITFHERMYRFDVPTKQTVYNKEWDGTHKFPLGVHVFNRVNYTFSGLIPIPGKVRFFVWVKPLYLAVTNFHFDFADTLTQSRTTFNRVDTFFPVGQGRSVYVAIGISEAPPDTPLSFGPAASVAILNRL